MFKRKLYQKLLMSLLLAAIALPQTWAEELVVGDQSTTSEYVPFYSNYMDDYFEIIQNAFFHI